MANASASKGGPVKPIRELLYEHHREFKFALDACSHLSNDALVQIQMDLVDNQDDQARLLYEAAKARYLARRVEHETRHEQP